MRQSLPFVLAAILLFPGVSAASVVTANDLVKLNAAGLNDDILIALIESDGAVFKLTADDILSLRERGLSQKVILAMLQTAKKASPAAPPRDGAVRPVSSEALIAPEVPSSDPPAPPPIVVNVTQQVEQHVEQPRRRSYGETTYISVPVAVPVYVLPPRPERKSEPVYWGFGGQRRPDTWRDKDK